MRLYRWLPVLLVAILVIGINPARAQDSKIKTKNNIVTVQPTYDDTEKLPALLGEEDIAKINRLQTETVYPIPSSPVSPDDQTVFVTTNNQMGFLNINDGSIVELTQDALGPYLPLPFVGISGFSWLDDATLGTLAINYDANTPAEYLVLLGINRDTLELNSFPLTLPDDLGVVSVSPDLTHFLMVVIPPLDATSSGSASVLTTKVQIACPRYRLPARPRPCACRTRSRPASIRPARASRACSAASS